MPIRKERELQEEFLPSRKAVIVQFDEGEFDLDEDIKKLQKVMIKPTYVNLETAFWNDSIAVSFSNITAAVIVGDGIRIRMDNQKALDIIKSWNRSINVKRQTIEDWIRETWFDSIVYARFFWRVDNKNPEYDNVDIQRLDPKTIEIREDPVMGFRKFVQHVPSYKYHRTKKQFYRSRESEIAYLTDWEQNKEKVTYGEGSEKFKDRHSIKDLEVHLWDEPNVILFGDFFQKPPIANALHFITYKKWVLWFMRKYSQKHWAPFVVLRIGDPKSNTYPSDPHKMQKAIDNGRDIIRQITNWGGVSIPGEMDLKTLETQTARSSEIYVLYIRELDKQIMYTIFGSMGQREASGNELATARILEQGWLRFIKGIRREYELILTNFYANVLLPYNGINNVKPEDIDIDWSELRFESSEELMNAIAIGAQAGIFKDQNEMRKAAQAAFSFLDPLPEAENNNAETLINRTKAKTSPESRLMEYNKQRKNK